MNIFNIFFWDYILPPFSGSVLQIYVVYVVYVRGRPICFWYSTWNLWDIVERYFSFCCFLFFLFFPFLVNEFTYFFLFEFSFLSVDFFEYLACYYFLDSLRCFWIDDVLMHFTAALGRAFSFPISDERVFSFMLN